MATINFEFRGKRDTGNLTLRFKHSTQIDYRISSKIISKREYWYKTNGIKRRLSELSYLDADAKMHKKYLERVQEDLLIRFNQDFNNGVPISKDWVVRNIREVTAIISSKKEIQNKQEEINQKEKERVSKEQKKYTLNLLTSALKRVKEVEYFNNPIQAKTYNQTLNKVLNFQKDNDTEVKISEVTQDFINLFTAYLVNDLQHQMSTAKKHCKSIVHAVKYQSNAYPKQVERPRGIEDVKYPKMSKSQARQRRDEIVITLSFEELDLIHQTPVPHHLLDAKKCILFGSEVGLRISDFKKLNEDNIKISKNGCKYWHFYNQKTGYDVNIPMNDRILKYIDFYGMPRAEFKTNDDVILNRQIKEICKMANIDEVVKSRKSVKIIIKGEETKRKVSGRYKKYEVITCHSLRRSFATNYHKIIGLDTTRMITGHTNNEQLLEYINQSEDKENELENALELMNANAEKLKNKSKLKIVK